MRIQIIPAQKKDSDFFLVLRNEPVMVQKSLNPTLVSSEQHKTWYHRSIHSKYRKLFVIIINRKRGGYIRFEERAHMNFVSICLLPEFRKKGYGPRAIDTAFQKTEIKKPVYAEIKFDNTASIKAFHKAGFTLLKEATPSCAISLFARSS